MQFNKLRLFGFKSFVEPTELLIEPGITGVVGPNGCGKSNVIEALRWVMGETSAKKMRGGEMDDVIFGGTSGRPSRNVAEVQLALGNPDRTAPAAYNEFDEIVIQRRIERGHGSAYRVNGREVRARDVQLLFADLSTGAHSTAIVGQGRISALIGAKPAERRVLLEEAAGIRGIHSRRHEAELRLRGAETNLERLDDVIGALEGQYQGLQRQARQAKRYRRLSEQIRTQEAILLHLRWLEASGQVEEAQERLREAESTVAARTAAAASVATDQAEKVAVLPDLRRLEAEAAAELQRLLVAQRELDNEETRVAEARNEVGERQRQIAADIRREEDLAGDATQGLASLDAEKKDIRRKRDGEAQAIAAAHDTLAAVTVQVEEREAALTELTEESAALEAERASLVRRSEVAEARITRLREQLEDLANRKRDLSTSDLVGQELSEATTAVEAAARRADQARQTLADAETATQAAREAEGQSRSRAEAAHSSRTKVAAEIEALVDVLGSGEGDLFAPLIDGVVVEPGCEAALGIVLGDDLEGSLDTAAPRHWVEQSSLSEDVSLPAGIMPLAKLVQGPAVLNRALSQIGIVETAQEARMMRHMLLPGQCLVSKDGGLCRWDGYTVAPGAATAATKRLAQRNRLMQLRDSLEDVDRLAKEAEADHTAADRRVEELQSAEREARRVSEAVMSELTDARDRNSRLAGQMEAQESKRAAVDDNMTRLLADLADTETEQAEANDAFSKLAPPDEARERINAMRSELADLRTSQVEHRTVYETLVREGEARASRLQAIDNEMQTWADRIRGAEQRKADLESRRQNAVAELARLKSRPQEIQQSRVKLLDAIQAAESGRKASADSLASAENDRTEADNRLRDAEASLAESREVRVRREAELEQAQQSLETVAERITERLDCAPHEVLERGGVEPTQDFPPREETEQKVERLTRERDNMGPVNLRAEQESADLEQQINTMQSEREDLIAAINRLRQGINALNREGRERLLAAFEEVNKHFEDLFVRLFGGGRAHLALTENDDPLEAGLEIMASPPGKRMQVMSLLSGGEQALTALSLLFAVFLTNPAPICVLDEVDAPLDDANVDRFCTMLEEIAHSGTTRFLVVTHHRMTMARMDRLYGVTMGERGVSQLVSVDLRQAEELRQTA